jgi:hypothetical protein
LVVMEELGGLPELVGLVLSQADPLDLVACRFVCTTWMHLAVRSKRLAWRAAVGAGQRLSLGQMDVLVLGFKLEKDTLPCCCVHTAHL